MTDIINTVRRLVGRRHKISRQQMADIIVALGIPADMHTITGRFADGSLYVGGRTIPAGGDESGAVARAWAEMCRGITTVSVLAHAEEVSMRHDDPGSMHPMHMAEVMFVSSEQMGREYDPIGYLRRHTRRLLIVDAASTLAPLPAPPAPPEELREQALLREMQQRLAAQLRDELELDPPWSEILEDATLQMIDPNDNAKTRYQYRVRGDCIQRRRLPPAEVGDCWRGEDAPPPWEDEEDGSHLRGSLVWEYYRAVIG